MTSILFIEPVSTVTADYVAGVVYSVDDTFAAQMIAAGHAQVPPSQYAKTQGETHYWPLRFDAIDRAGTKNLLAYSGTSFNLNPNGMGFEAGITGYMACPQTWNWSATGFTMMVRYTPQLEFATEVLWSQYADDPNSVVQLYRIDDVVYFSGYFDDEGNYQLLDAQQSGALLPYSESFIACVYDPATLTIKLYANGGSAVTAPISGPLLNNTTLPLSVGANSIGNYTCTGTMRDVRYFDRALSDSEIAAFYAQG